MTWRKGLGFVPLSWPALEGGGGGNTVASPGHTEAESELGVARESPRFSLIIRSKESWSWNSAVELVTSFSFP